MLTISLYSRKFIFILLLIISTILPFGLYAEEREKGTVAWDNRLSLYGGMTGGNTESKQGGGDFRINRNKLWVNEFTLTGNGAYQKNDGELIVRNYEIAPRFGWSITKSFYNFYRVAYKHNRILYISSQYIPSGGFGYWFIDNDAFKLLIEAGGGYNTIHYEDGKTKRGPIFQPRFFMEINFSEHYSFGNNTYYYYGVLKRILESVTYFKIHADEHVAAKFEYIVNYNNTPGYELKKYDYILRSGIELKM